MNNERNFDPMERNPGIKVDGMQQVVDLLVAADREFRESLLRRMAVKDRNLVATLRKRLATLGIY